MFHSGGLTISSRWQNYIEEFIEQLKVYIFAVVYLGLFRLVLIVYFNDKLDTSTDLSDIFLAMAHGFRFDSGIAALVILVPFLANIALSPFGLTPLAAYLRRGFSVFMVVIMTLVFVVTIPYFKEYDSQFDYFLFEILYDDRSAVMRTIIEGYNLLSSILAFSVISILCFFLLKRWHRLPFTPLSRLLTQPKNLLPRSLIAIAIVLLTFAAARGSFRSRPAMRKWADITTDIFLNQTVMNPIRHLHYAYKDFRSINSKREGIQKLLGDISVRTAAKEYFSLDLPEDKAGDLSNYLQRTASGSLAEMPDHIFIIVMESYDSWPLLPRYKSLKIADNLEHLGENGVFFNHFLPAGSNTIASISAILLGIPYTGLNISRIAASKPPFLTSTPGIFKRLGYKTRLYYGGFISWQNIGNLFQAQGIDEIYAAPSIEEKVPDGVWGVEDEQLFQFIQTNTTAGVKTLNIILTTTYHPPFNLDVKTKGFPLSEIPADIRADYDGSITLNQLGHFWYCDREVGKFVNAIEKVYPSSLFAITGDHYGRRFLNSRPSIYEHTSVPFILYSKKFITPQGTRNPTPGSHIDIIPTIVELIAPAGFQYHSFGRSMLDRGEKGNKPAIMRFGIGHQTIVAENFIANLKIDRNPAPLPDTDFVNNSELFHSLVKKHDQFLGLGWWLMLRGEVLEASVAPD
ncbi:MAG: sulfatase-like hydrolase/transferase [Fidelibacterota bacterium]|nr:MAG: sulfatase-like hydrolase/transferase [Candidatus Neomarinimicrobiota bacterium]